jgi:hypothetical protein
MRMVPERRDRVTVRRAAKGQGRGGPGAASEHAVFLSEVRTRQRTAGVGLVPRRGPFHRVARHVVRFVGAHVAWMTTHRRGVAAGGVLQHRNAFPVFVAPRPHTPVLSARGLLPLRLGGQSLARPAAIRVRVVPRHVDDRMAVAPRVPVAPHAGLAVSGRGHERAIVFLSDLVLVDPERGEFDAVLRRFVHPLLIPRQLRIRCATHGESSGGNQHHSRRSDGVRGKGGEWERRARDYGQGQQR